MSELVQDCCPTLFYNRHLSCEDLAQNLGWFRSQTCLIHLNFSIHHCLLAVLKEPMLLFFVVVRDLQVFAFGCIKCVQHLLGHSFYSNIMSLKRGKSWLWRAVEPRLTKGQELVLLGQRWSIRIPRKLRVDVSARQSALASLNLSWNDLSDDCGGHWGIEWLPFMRLISIWIAQLKRSLNTWGLSHFRLVLTWVARLLVFHD